MLKNSGKSLEFQLEISQAQDLINVSNSGCKQCMALLDV